MAPQSSQHLVSVSVTFVSMCNTCVYLKVSILLIVPIVSVVSIPSPRYFDRKCIELNGDSDWFWKLKSCFSRFKDLAALHLSFIKYFHKHYWYMCGSSRIQAWILEYYILELDFGEDNFWKGRLVKPEWKSESWTNWSEPMRLEVVELHRLDKMHSLLLHYECRPGAYCCALHCLQRVGDIGGELGSD